MKDQPQFIDPVEAVPEPQRTYIRKIQNFISALRKIRPPSRHSDIFVGKVDKNGVARFQCFARDGLYEVQTIEFEFPIMQWDYARFVTRFAKEYGAMFEALCLKTYAPDLYNGDTSPVSLVEQKTVGSMDFM